MATNRTMTKRKAQRGGGGFRKGNIEIPATVVGLVVRGCDIALREREKCWLIVLVSSG